jgi:molecular chaperone GrpE
MSDDKQDIVEEDGASSPESAAEHHPEVGVEVGAEDQSHSGATQNEASEEGANQEGTTEPSLEETIERLEADLGEAKEAALRAQADAINVQRRAEAEVDKARKFALERFVGEMLPVADNLERALAAAGEGDADKAIIEGVELTLKSLVDALRKNGVESIDPMGEPFDPQTAQAMSMVENPDVEPNTVIAVMQKGYSLNGRLVRPAMVMVSKAAQ